MSSTNGLIPENAAFAIFVAMMMLAFQMKFQSAPLTGPSQ
jgi:hypothetical protein